MKEVFLILAFHAHEPLWELPQKLTENIDDPDLKQALRDENWLLKRSQEGRDIYLDLVNFARAMRAPAALEITSELLIQIARIAPRTLDELKKAFSEGILYPVYGHAHHTHVSLLTEVEIEDEIRLNKEYLHDVLGIPEPKHPGLFPVEDSLDSTKLGALRRAGIQWVIFPNIDRHKSRYEADEGLNIPYEPFLIHQDLIALPRHFSISQYIWRPITKWKVDGVKYQGYMLGRYWVLPEEYRDRQYVKFPVDKEQAINEYRAVVVKALKETPDGGLLLYIQDLELMDFGDAALDILQEVWGDTRETADTMVHIVSPDEYLEKNVIPRTTELKRLRFHKVSWAPEIRLVLRYDGHYPPLEAGQYRGRDAAEEIFRRMPFVFWEPGRYLARLVNCLLTVFGYKLEVPLSAAELYRLDYDFKKLSEPARLALHARLIKRACNWGWFPNEGLQKRPFLHGFCLADLLLSHLRARTELGLMVKEAPPLAETCFQGLERILEVIVDTRCSYLTEAVVSLSLRSGWEYEEAFKEIDTALMWRHRATRSILRCQHHYERLQFATGSKVPTELERMLSSFRDYCRAVFVSIDHIQRTWVKAGDVDSLITTMYEYLNRLYPPKFPDILWSTLSDEEITELERPSLI